MSGESRIFALDDDQRHGAVPGDNIWLSASAGTGKTQVLTARVLRLLLAGVEPEAILGLTYTKAGAAEMAQRVRGALAHWVQLDDRALSNEIYKIRGPHLDAAVIARARTLFAKVIDAPGQGLAFQTIHSFCQSVLGSFPLEASLPQGFRTVEDREAVLLRREVLDGLVATAPVAGDGWFIDALGTLAERLPEAAVTGWLDRCAAAAPALRAMPDTVQPWLRDKLDLPGSNPDDWLVRQCADEHIDMAGWREIVGGFINWGAPTGKKLAEQIEAWLASSPAERAANITALWRTVYTKERALNGKFAKAFAGIEDLAMRCADAAIAVERTATAMRAADRLALALRVGRHFADAWVARKRRDGLVEFDDLIRHMLKLLDSDGRAEWIRYKLDQRIDHILVDEAQDTNSDQWHIVRRLTEEYFAGEGAHDPALRTLFVVGDYKQAIFGFQGTDPRHFAAEEANFRALGDAAERPFAALRIDTNYRSEAAILRVVDAVAAQIGPERFGLPPTSVIAHTPFRKGGYGQVVLWPTVAASGGAAAADAEEDWVDNATLLVADRIAQQVRRWIDHGLDGAPVEPRDVLVLVRKRKDLAALIVARLQTAGVAVAGVDRMALHRPLAVQDLLSAARFVLQPLDDLNLAALLVSPLGGFTQDELWEYGIREQGGHLWPHLRAQSALAERLAPLHALLGMADLVTPYRFFETILSGPMQGRAKLLGRLGAAARDPIDELLTAALAHERRNGASLHGFLRWFDTGDIELKRENDVVANEARVMTVHGSKGLEAKIVILADAAANPDAGGTDGDFTWLPPGHVGPLPVTGIRKDERPDALAAAHAAKAERDRAEHWRLLYVAMTRAQERLFVTGALGVRDRDGPAADSWYARIDAGMRALAAAEQDGDIWPSALAYPARARLRGPDDKARRQRGAPPALPDWLMRPPADEPRPLRPLAPSLIAEEQTMAVSRRPTGNRDAARRGTLMHALFERLPPVQPGDRRAAAERWLVAQAPDLAPQVRAEMVAAVLAVLESSDFAALFAPDALAEVPFSALVGGRVIAGSVDRLRVDEQGIAIIDFKTGLDVPDAPESVPAPYLKQMAAYVAALEAIFPDRPVQAGLLYTAAPRLIALPMAVLAAHRPTA